MFGHALGRLEGKRRQVRRYELVQIRAGVTRVQMTLECGHIAFRRDNGTRPIWAICEKCRIEETLED